jgi:allantoinase
VSAFDVLLRGGLAVTPDGVRAADVGILDGAIAALEPELAGGAREVVDARGLHVLPGAIDAHVHVNEPGRSEWEGFRSASHAMAAGGTTCFLDMPLNASPPTLDGPAFDAKLAAARAASLVDFALWGGLVPGGVDRLAELAERGAVGFKAFMCPSGIDDFEAADDATLEAGLREAGRLGLPVAVHAEDAALAHELGARARGRGATSLRDWCASRPPLVELRAIGRALELAAAARARLHVVHVSCAAGVDLVAQARGRVDATCETCPHYLLLDEDDALAIGALAKCAPPLRGAGERERLWERLAAGGIDLVASDHSPSPPRLKAGDGFAAWGGISGCQTLLAAVLAGGAAHGLALTRLIELVSAAPAAVFGLPGKGVLAVGADADVVLVDPAAEFELRAADLRYRHPQSALVGRTLRGRVVRTLVRGRTVFAGGEVVDTTERGRLVSPRPRPARAAA